MKALRTITFAMTLAIGLTGCAGLNAGPFGFALAPVQPVHVGSPQSPTINADYRTWGVWAFGSW